MTARRGGNAAAGAVVLILALGLAIVLVADLPGHLSYDSIVQLHEGRFHVRDTWAPKIYGVILGFFDSILRGTALYVAASGLLFFGSLASLVLLRPSTSWLAPVVALAIVLSPLVVIYQGIVWKDVLFANCAVAGCIALAHAARAWDRRLLRWGLLILALLLLGLAGQVRQNGLVVGLAAAVALGWTRRGAGGPAAFAWGLFGFFAIVAASHLMSMAVETRQEAREAQAKGVRIVQQYDLVGALARDPTFRLATVAQSHPKAEAIIRAEAPKVYTPSRVDTFEQSQALMGALRAANRPQIAADWRRLIAERPDLYVRQRLEVFRWLVDPPNRDLCLPVYLGVDGPADLMAELKIVRRWDARDAQLFDYARRFYRTPVFSHVFYGVLALAAGLCLLLRRDPQDMPIVALMAGALGFAATFLIISLACDLRYLYLLDLAGMTGALYVALDPRLRRRGA